MGDRFRLWEYVGLPINEGYAVARIIDIDARFYKINYINNGMKDLKEDKLYKIFVDREFIGLGMDKDIIELLFF